MQQGIEWLEHHQPPQPYLRVNSSSQLAASDVPHEWCPAHVVLDVRVVIGVTAIPMSAISQTVIYSRSQILDHAVCLLANRHVKRCSALCVLDVDEVRCVLQHQGGHSRILVTATPVQASLASTINSLLPMSVCTSLSSRPTVTSARAAKRASTLSICA